MSSYNLGRCQVRIGTLKQPIRVRMTQKLQARVPVEKAELLTRATAMSTTDIIIIITIIILSMPAGFQVDQLRILLIWNVMGRWPDKVGISSVVVNLWSVGVYFRIVNKSMLVTESTMAMVIIIVIIIIIVSVLLILLIPVLTMTTIMALPEDIIALDHLIIFE